MAQESRPVLIGVDGGGSTCRLALVLPSGARRELTAGSANVSSGFDAAVATVGAALREIAAAAGLDAAALRDARAHLGLAGVVDAAIAARVAAALPVARARVTDDRPTTLAGALGDAPGAVAGIGTGSFLARQAGARLALLGGWGFVIGDQASGAWLGRRLLEEAMLRHDGIGAPSPLAEAMLAEHGGPSGAVAFSFAAKPRDYAALAPRVAAAAAEGEALAMALMREGADYIARALTALGWRPGEALCLTGGLGPAYRDWLPEEMRAAVVAPKGSALDGALILATREGGA